MTFETYVAPKRVFIFSLDDVLYPEKDYLLQVYYLFSEFIEYSTQLNAKNILAFMQQEYSNHGHVNIFEKTAAKFDIPEKYKSNFELLHENARLPLKLLLFRNILSFLQEIVIERKEICILATGKPMVQLNKIKQLEWHGLEHYLKVYFSEEIEPSLSEKSLDFLIRENKFKMEDILYIGNDAVAQKAAMTAGVDFLFVEKLL